MSLFESLAERMMKNGEKRKNFILRGVIMKNKYWVIVVIFILLIIGQGIFIFNDSSNVVLENGIKSSGELERAENIYINSGNVITQKFTFDDVILNKILVYFEKINPNVSGKLDIEIKDENGNIISQYSPKLEEFASGIFYIVFFYEADDIKQNVDYFIEVTVDGNVNNDFAIKVVNSTPENEWLYPISNNIKDIENKVAYIELDREYLNFEKRENQIESLVNIDLIIVLSFFIFWLTIKYRKILKEYIWERVRIYFRDNAIYVMLIILSVIAGIFHSLKDILFIFLLFSASYVYGGWFLKIFKVKNKLANMGVGLCLLGVVVCYLLSFGFGAGYVYVALLVVPIIYGHKMIIYELREVRKIVSESLLYSSAIFLILVFYIVMGSGPIEVADALTKHLPISVYAAELGKWYDNIFENILAYSESTLLHYSYTTIMVEFGCYKALTLFNVFLFFVIYSIVYKFVIDIYKKTNKWLLLITYFFIPYILQITTSFTVDIFPMLIVFTCLSLIQDFSSKDIIKRIPVLGFMFGCAVYTKLTILSSMLVIAVIIIGMIIIYFFSKRCKQESLKDKRKNVISFLGGIILFFIPFLYSFSKNWYMTGNPFSITAYNDIFKSPYFSVPIDRPFTDNGMGANLSTFFNVTFHTSTFVEAYDGAMGYIWLLIILVPIVAICMKNKKLIAWFLANMFGLQIAGIIVGNLRYVIAIFIMFASMIVISVSVLINLVKNSKLRGGIVAVVGCILLIPNIIFMKENINWSYKLQPSENITRCDNTDILSFVPNNSSIFSINDDLKGSYEGFYFSLNWCNGYIFEKLENGEISLSDFMKQFDYVLYRKVRKIGDNEYDEMAASLLEEAIDNKMVEEIAQNEMYILYRYVDSELSEIASYSENLLLNEGEYISVTLEDVKQYQVNIDVSNEIWKSFVYDENSCEIYIERVCQDSEGNIIDYASNCEQISMWRMNIETDWVSVPHDTECITIKVRNSDNNKVILNTCQIKVRSKYSAFTELQESFYNREELK